jgi:hypothetical protein
MPRAPGAGTPSSVTVLTGQLTTAQPKRPAPETVSAGRHRVACSPPPPARPNRLANAHPGAHSPVSVASSIAAGSRPKKGTAAGLSRTINSVSRTVQDFFQLFPSSYVGNCEQTDSSPPAARAGSHICVSGLQRSGTAAADSADYRNELTLSSLEAYPVQIACSPRCCCCCCSGVPGGRTLVPAVVPGRAYRHLCAGVPGRRTCIPRRADPVDACLSE